MLRAIAKVRKVGGAPRRCATPFGAALRCEDGSAAVEFALVIPAFLALVMSIMELGMIFLQMTVVDGAVAETSRLIRTGQAASLTQDELIDSFCGSVSGFVSCGSNVTAEVRVIDTFSDIPTAGATCRDGDETPEEQPDVNFDSAASGEIVFCAHLPDHGHLYPGSRDRRASLSNQRREIRHRLKPCFPQRALGGG